MLAQLQRYDMRVTPPEDALYRMNKTPREIVIYRAQRYIMWWDSKELKCIFVSF